jgi:hypothetical protein
MPSSPWEALPGERGLDNEAFVTPLDGTKVAVLLECDMLLAAWSSDTLAAPAACRESGPAAASV